MAKCYALLKLGDIYNRHYPVLPVPDIFQKLKIKVARDFVAVQWLKRWCFHCRTQVASLAGELRPHMWHGAAKPSYQMAWYQGKNTTAHRLLNQFPVVHICRIVI